jgi:hypothetical protein
MKAMNEKYGHLIYLACPYSDPDPAVMEKRFEAANMVALSLMIQGQHVFSPISHCHPLAQLGGLPRGWDFWKKYDSTMISRCEELY